MEISPPRSLERSQSPKISSPTAGTESAALSMRNGSSLLRLRSTATDYATPLKSTPNDLILI
jgi:hypothetical protein